MTWIFCLGGPDLEMLEIKRLVTNTAGPAAVADRQLPWHAAKASAYLDVIEDSLSQDLTPVLIELAPDLPGPMLARCLLIDHHGARAGADRPTSLEQVFALLDLPAGQWTRRMQLIAANDRGWIPELREMGATFEEIMTIRACDRAAQGITKTEEAAAQEALQQALSTKQPKGWLHIQLPHARTAPVFDRLEAENPGFDALVQSPAELNFSGRGPAVLALAQAFPSGWHGGALPKRGFWGHAKPLPAIGQVAGIIAKAIN